MATGSDDKLACLYELKAGSGQTAFGSTDGPNVENWKLYSTLRGHSSHITDLAWSLDDINLATCRWKCLYLVFINREDSIARPREAI